MIEDLIHVDSLSWIGPDVRCETPVSHLLQKDMPILAKRLKCVKAMNKTSYLWNEKYAWYE
jgi:hypothetical protein